MITAATGQVTSWAGNISEIGPLYPFVGGEVLYFFIGFVLWIIWHIIQFRMENKIYDGEIKKFGSKANMKKIISGETPGNP